FFSSRRRHTRSKRDWSSDVCSSDLVSEQANNSPADANASWPPEDPPSKPKPSKRSMKSLPVLKNLPPPQLASLTEYGSSGSPRPNAQHETKPPSAMHYPPDTGSNPKANPSKTTNSSTPTNAPTTSPKPSEPTTANPTSHQCATVLLWPAESAHTSPKESLNRPSLTAARANPAQAEKH